MPGPGQTVLHGHALGGPLGITVANSQVLQGHGLAAGGELGLEPAGHLLQRTRPLELSELAGFELPFQSQAAARRPAESAVDVHRLAHQVQRLGQPGVHPRTRRQPLHLCPATDLEQLAVRGLGDAKPGIDQSVAQLGDTADLHIQVRTDAVDVHFNPPQPQGGAAPVLVVPQHAGVSHIDAGQAGQLPGDRALALADGAGANAADAQCAGRIANNLDHRTDDIDRHRHDLSAHQIGHREAQLQFGDLKGRRRGAHALQCHIAELERGAQRTPGQVHIADVDGPVHDLGDPVLDVLLVAGRHKHGQAEHTHNQRGQHQGAGHGCDGPSPEPATATQHAIRTPNAGQRQ